MQEAMLLMMPDLYSGSVNAFCRRRRWTLDDEGAGQRPVRGKILLTARPTQWRQARNSSARIALHATAVRPQDVREPPNLHSERVRAATPGELEWLLKNGSMKNGMPSWSRLPEQQRWQIVAFLKSLQ